MNDSRKNLAILGSTGSIGTQTLDIVRAFPNDLRVVGLSAHKNLDLLETQIKEFKPQMISCSGNYSEKAPLLANGCKECHVDEIVSNPAVDLIMNATTGDVSLYPTFKAIDLGKPVALANKETIVMAGEMLTKRAHKSGASILPVDSEPSAIWQCMKGEKSKISKIILTASGGPFRHANISQLSNVTPEQALNHPTWQMGNRITIDSATLMNKAFEVIEIHWLFDVPWDNIEVVIHPQSIIHAMVEFEDGSVKAQLSIPDMRLPIQYALLYPNRVDNLDIPKFNPLETGSLTFEPLKNDLYPSFELALKYAKRGGTWPSALCGADEMAVELFLSKSIGFLEIPTLIQESLKDHQNISNPSIQHIIDASNSAKQRVKKLVED